MPAYFRECTRCGIMLWQEFLQSTSGLDDVPCGDPHYLELLRKGSLHAIKTRRNHPSLVYWCGGNELCDSEGMSENGRVNDSVSYSDGNIAMLHGLVSAYDPDRLFLPSSGSVGHKLLSLKEPQYNYDVHGPWQYEGAKEEYTIFNCSNAIWNTEYGCGGLCAVSSVEEITGERALDASEDNLLWRHHGGHWDKVSVRETVLFGDFAKDDLPQLVICSQLIQGEAVRYGMEENRRKEFRSCGVIVWNYNDPFTNLHSSAVYNYFGRKKLAYYMLADSCRSFAPTLRYHSLAYDAGSPFLAEVWLLNDAGDRRVAVRWQVLGPGDAVLMQSQYSAEAEHGATIVCGISFNVKKEFGDGFEIRLEANGETSRYLFFIPDKNGKLSRAKAEQFYQSYSTFHMEYNGFVYQHGGDIYAHNLRNILKRAPSSVRCRVYHANHHFFGSIDPYYLRRASPYLLIMGVNVHCYSKSAHTHFFMREVENYLKSHQGRLLETIRGYQTGNTTIRINSGESFAYETYKENKEDRVL